MTHVGYRVICLILGAAVLGVFSAHGEARHDTGGKWWSQKHCDRLYYMNEKQNMLESYVRPQGWNGMPSNRNAKGQEAAAQVHALCPCSIAGRLTRTDLP